MNGHLATESDDEPVRHALHWVGKGTPSSRLKAKHPVGVSLRSFVRQVATLDRHPLQSDANKWLASKLSRNPKASK